MIETLLKLIYPPKCILCRRLLEDQEAYFCMDCYNKFRSERKALSKLRETEAYPAGLDETEEEREEGRIIGIYALFPYSNEYRRAILRWKYAGIRKYAKGFAELFVDELHLFEWIKIDALIPVPIAPSRKRKRGFNQALDLAEAISEKTGIPVMDCLLRKRNTKPQSSCSREERGKNIKGSMICSLKQQNMDTCINNVAVIDDIYTTGSTVKECCRALKSEYLFRNINIYVLVTGKGDY